MKSHRRLIVLPVVLLTALLFASPAGASHSWSGFHWARTTNPFTLQLGDDVSSTWDPYLAVASTDWSQSKVLDTTIKSGLSSPRRCAPTSGRVEVCNSKYGTNGWLGLASVWANGSHITQATVKLNDTYFSMAAYNTQAWRQSVMCQEVGHTLGLGHNDEDFSTTTGTCMDYSNDPTANQHPDAHDYAQLDGLEGIYSHLESSTTVASAAAASQAAAGGLLAQDQWGQARRYDSKGRPVVFERGLGGRQTVTTFVIWA